LEVPTKHTNNVSVWFMDSNTFPLKLTGMKKMILNCSISSRQK